MQNLFAENWNQLREPIKTWWDRLDDIDLDEIAGDCDILVSKLQQKYGINVHRAEAQVNQRLREFEREHSVPVGH